ncbi:tetratricopeptide repeat protein [Methyloversatilis sp.]|uniref:tetratricopeptide repeat protein n=1 Tax=Methyloversatilis sp. TaxID=2569862 RepID=UPI003D2B77C6
MRASPRQRGCSRLLPVLVAVCVQWAPLPLVADEGNRFCGGAMQPASPDDLDNAVGELSLQYVASQPAGPVSCAAGYLLSKCGDHETANKVFDKCIAAGYTGALIWKALMYENGQGVPQDPVKATEMLLRAATSGDPYYGPLGKMHYATALYQGRGVERNVEEAMRWFREAAAEGDESAQEFLRTGHHTAVRDGSGQGVGEAPAPAMTADARADLAAADFQLAAARVDEGAPAPVRARRLGGSDTVAPEPATAPSAPSAPPAPEAAPAAGRRLVEVTTQPVSQPAPDRLWLLPLLAAFAAGALARLRQRPAVEPAPAPQLRPQRLRRAA